MKQRFRIISSTVILVGWSVAALFSAFRVREVLVPVFRDDALLTYSMTYRILLSLFLFLAVSVIVFGLLLKRPKERTRIELDESADESKVMESTPSEETPPAAKRPQNRRDSGDEALLYSIPPDEPERSPSRKPVARSAALPERRQPPASEENVSFFSERTPAVQSAMPQSPPAPAAIEAEAANGRENQQDRTDSRAAPRSSEEKSGIPTLTVPERVPESTTYQSSSQTNYDDLHLNGPAEKPGSDEEQRNSAQESRFFRHLQQYEAYHSLAKRKGGSFTGSPAESSARQSSASREVTFGREEPDSSGEKAGMFSSKARAARDSRGDSSAVPEVYEDSFEFRLDRELHSSIEHGYDLSIALIRLRFKDKNRPGEHLPLYEKALFSFLGSSAYIYLHKDSQVKNNYACIIPFANYNETEADLLGLYRYLKDALDEENIIFSCGFSSSFKRDIEAEQFFNEAASSLKKALKRRSFSIMGFEPDIDMFETHLNINEQ